MPFIKKRKKSIEFINDGCTYGDQVLDLDTRQADLDSFEAVF